MAFFAIMSRWVGDNFNSKVKMRRLSIIIIVCSLLILASASTVGAVYDVTDYGATGNGSTLDSPAINAAIEDANAHGGGTVYLPPGTYKSGSIRLKSNITLNLDANATILATDTLDYDVKDENPWVIYAGFGNSYWKCSLIWAKFEENIAITGSGTIYGAGNLSNSDCADGAGNKTVGFRSCNGVLVKDVTFHHCGHYAIKMTGCNDVDVENLKVDTNRDGITFDNCHDVNITGCYVSAHQDDAITLKSTYAMGYKRDCNNVNISGCTVMGYELGTFLDGTKVGAWPWVGRIKFGTESVGGFRNVTITNCTFESCMGFMIASVDGGVMENVNISNITMNSLVWPPIFIRLGDRDGSSPGDPAPGIVRNININNLTARVLFSRSMSSGICGIVGHYVEDVNMSNMDIMYQGGGTAADALIVLPENDGGYPDPDMFGDITPCYGFYLRHVDGINFRDVRLNVATNDERPKYKFVDALNIDIDNFLSSIDSPADGAVAFYGEPVTFSGSGDEGTEPYSYQWQSSVDGNLGTGSELIVTDLSVNRWGGELLPHIITLNAEDSNGHSDTAQVELTVKYRGDFSSDGDVDFEDFTVMASDWFVSDYNVPMTFEDGLYHIPRATSAPTLDGVISAGEWSGALVVEMDDSIPGSFVAGESGEDIHTTWQFMWDSSYLHVAGRMYDSSHDFLNSSPGPYNGQDVIQICFNPNNDPAHTFVEGSGVSAIYDLVTQTSDTYGPDVYRHGLPNNTVPGALSSGTIHGDGWTYEGSIPWSELMVGENTGYVPSVDDEHGLGLIIISWKSSSYTLITNFGNGSNTIGHPTTWNKMILVEDFSDCTLGYYNHDLNEDCVINFKDIAIMADKWLK